MHCHDTYGQGLNNILISIQKGIATVDSSVRPLQSAFCPCCSNSLSLQRLVVSADPFNSCSFVQSHPSLPTGIRPRGLSLCRWRHWQRGHRGRGLHAPRHGCPHWRGHGGPSNAPSPCCACLLELCSALPLGFSPSTSTTSSWFVCVQGACGCRCFYWRCLGATHRITSCCCHPGQASSSTTRASKRARGKDSRSAGNGRYPTPIAQ